ncbi:MAG TPA: hemolysin family protein [Acidimicrobiales bacterium]
MSVWPFVLIIVLLAVNGFFVALEFALVGSRRSRLEPLAAAGDRNAQRALEDMSDLSIQLAGAQLGITVASLILGLVGEPAMAHLLEGPVSVVPGIPDSWAHGVAGVIGILLVVFAHMVMGEMVPKNLTLAHPETTLRVVGPPNRVYLAVVRPLVWILNAVANVGVRSCGVEPRDELGDAHTAEELAVMVALSREEGTIEGFAGELLSGVLAFSDRQVASVMVPRDLITTMASTATPAAIEATVLSVGHSRMPVLGPGGLDDVLGFVHAKDLLQLPPSAFDRPLPPRLLRRMLVVPPERTLEDLLLAMRRSRVHFALVTDSDGNTAGIVTLDDLLEELVGDITDEPE